MPCGKSSELSLDGMEPGRCRADLRRLLAEAPVTSLGGSQSRTPGGAEEQVSSNGDPGEGIAFNTAALYCSSVSPLASVLLFDLGTKNKGGKGRKETKI